MKYFSVAAIFKNEALYLEEWLLHYYKQGADHFYLFNNDSDDHFKEVLKPFISDDLVTLHNISGSKKQREAYDFVIDAHKQDTEWCAFFDCDEFLYSGRDNRLVDTLSNYELLTVSGVAVHWLLFGSNGHLKYKPDPVLERFTKRAKEVNPHVKSIMRLKHTDSAGDDPHTFRAYGNVVDENLEVLPYDYAVTEGGTAEIFRLNHYAVKSKEECERKIKRGRADNGLKHNDDFFKVHDCNEVEDKRILNVG